MKWTHIAACALLGFLSACGGGGGGGSTPPVPSGTFTLSSNSVTFSAQQNGTNPASQSLTVTITGADVAYAGAAYTGGQTQPTWLSFNMTGSGSTYQLTLSVTSTAMSPGQYTSTFAVGTSDSKGNILQSQNVTVTFNVSGTVSAGSSPYTTTFTYGGSHTTQTLPVAVTASSGITWTASSDSSWLTVPSGNQSGSVTLSATVNITGLLPGTYQGHIQLVDTANAADTASVTVSITVQAPTISVTQTSLLLGGTDGLSTSTPQSLTFSLSTDTALHAFAIALSTTDGGNWLTADTASGSVNASGTTLQISGNRSALVGGTYTGQVKITATVGSLVLTSQVPVTFNIEANRIVVGAAGVGFSSSTAVSVLTRNVTVYSAIGRTDVPWQASSDQSWLTVTTSGVTGGAITLTAVPNGLAAGMHFANVTVKSSDTTVENQESIRVGLYVATAAPTNLSVSVAAQFLAADPVEPIVFINNAGTSVTGYNVYTGTVDRTFPGVATAAGSMVVSQDGQRLYVYDQTALAVVELDATSGTILHTYDATVQSYGNFTGALAYVRPSGYSMIVTPSSRAYDVTTTKEYDNQRWSGSLPLAYSLAVSPDSSRTATESGAVFPIQRSALSGGVFNVAQPFYTGTTTSGAAAGQACFSSDGKTIYVGNGAPYNFYGTNLTTYAQTVLTAQAYPTAIACAWNGEVVGGAASYYSANDIFVYNGTTGTQLATLDSSSMTNGYRQLLARGLALSADNTRLITLVSQNAVSQYGNEVRFQSLP